ncbi:hypothetical protein P171DRAFT_486239 [Karstenula rhodostoma CBS 690.94]|uniref:Uncharacterized protein n=1 Tax=Karstenula rhodostoma CBS 690.94 TaxID=1392251 RepID=A0A9P4PHZ2_9PLEO|nr:hypothetical protein P171DRAFT_486239 [Karstenula rhodostoma CBS 690.94]
MSNIFQFQQPLSLGRAGTTNKDSGRQTIRKPATNRRTQLSAIEIRDPQATPHRQSTPTPFSPATALLVMPAVFHRRTASSLSAATTSSSKPPSIFRYTLILLKARPSISDIDTISVYSESRSTAPSPTAQTTLREYFLVHEERVDERLQTPPPPYEPRVLPAYVEDGRQGA